MTVSQSPGEVYDPTSAHVQDPYPFYAQARREEPVFYSSRLGAWVVTRYDDIVWVNRHPELFSSANALRPVVPFAPAAGAELAKGVPFRHTTLDSDGAPHRRFRAPLTRLLSPEQVAAFEAFIRERATALVDGMASGATRRAEWMRQYAYPLPVQVIGHVMGIDPSDMAAIERDSYRIAQVLGFGASEAAQVDGAQGWVAVQNTIARYVRQRRQQPRQDLISQDVAALVPGHGLIPEEVFPEVVWHLVGVVIAGHTTTSSLLGTGLWHLLRNRGQWELLCQHPELIPGAVEELARYDSAVQGFFRVATGPVTVGGVYLAPGAEVLVLYGSGNRDERLVKDPDRLDVTRPGSKHLGFGWGPHLCVGANLARAEIRITLETLTRRLPNLRLADGERQNVRIRPGLLHRAPWRLDIGWDEAI
jgi:cytochrome P450